MSVVSPQILLSLCRQSAKSLCHQKERPPPPHRLPYGVVRPVLTSLAADNVPASWCLYMYQEIKTNRGVVLRLYPVTNVKHGRVRLRRLPDRLWCLVDNSHNVNNQRCYPDLLAMSRS